MSRIRCCVPGCNRTYHNRDGYAEWVCGDHWRLVSKRDRKAYAMVKRRWRSGRKDKAAVDRIWRRCRDRAIQEALMGIGL